MKEIKPQRGRLRENEILLKDNNVWLHFTRPYRVVAVTELQDVLSALREIEQLVEVNDWYAAGFLSYEAASAFDPALRTRADAILPDSDSARAGGFPYLWFGLYPKPRRVRLPGSDKPRQVLNWIPNVDRETYNAAVEKIKDLIASGWTYQVNYTMRLQADFTYEAWEFFLNLAQDQNNHAAYVDTGGYVVCSASPELFFKLDGDTITCRPMKGTTRRGRTTIEDHERSDWLRNSVKDRAENVMIVDMVRNDLGRIATIGSVHVPALFETERYPTLLQMTSTVTAQTNASLTEIFSALFPCASITGAPKVSTMQMIAELESTPRQIYTGSIGYISPQRKAKFNVAIRTVLVDRVSKTAEYGVGGGIVWDSTGPGEYAEALLKARVLTEEQTRFSLIETMLWTPEEGFFLCDKHLARMLDSANYFDIPITKERLEEFFAKLPSGFRKSQRARVLLDQDGRLHSESRPFGPEDSSAPLHTCLAKGPVDSGNVFLYHKTTQRGVYEWAREGCEGFEDVLLYNESGELTEFTIGNVVVEIEGQLWTPPVSCGVLPGTFRAHLLETGQVFERTMRVSLLKHCARIFRINSIRRRQQAEVELQP